MDEPESKVDEGPDRRKMPWLTMTVSLLSFLLFFGLVVVMIYLNRVYYQSPDEEARRLQVLEELRAADRKTLEGYGKTPKGYRIPIERAMELMEGTRRTPEKP